MNAIEQQLIADRLRASGIRVERAEVVAGNLKGWEPVAAEQLIGDWLRHGWKVSLEQAPTSRPLHLVRTEGPEL